MATGARVTARPAHHVQHVRRLEDMATSLSDITQRYEDLSARRALTHAVLAKALSGPGEYQAELERRLGPSSAHLSRLKTAVSVLGTGDAGVDSLRPLTTAWGDLVRRQTVIGRMAGAVRNVPAATQITTVDSGIAAAFVTEGAPIPCAKPTLADASLMPGKVAIIVPYSKELARATGDQAAILIERDGSRAVALGEDTALLDSAAAVAGGRPASILNGITPLVGGSAADLEADVLALLAAVRSGDPVQPYFITSPAGALTLISTRNSGGHRAFPDVTFSGGAIIGVPLIVSAGAPDDVLVLLDADSLQVADYGLSIDRAEAAAFQFNDAPSAGAQASVSLFQTNAVAFRFQRYIGWRLAWSDAVAAVTLPAGSPA